MARLTRNSYKRKIIVFGVLVFMSIALISTGFAAWIMSSSAENNTDGNVSVGVVSDSSIKFESIVISDYDGVVNYPTIKPSIQFEPVKDDHEGRLQQEVVSEGVALYEKLNVIVTGEVTNYDNVGKISYELTISESVYQAITLNYIVLKKGSESEVIKPVYAEDGETVTHRVISGTLEKVKKDNNASFEYKLEFSWGTVFGKENPSEYYEKKDENGKYLIDDETVKKTLEDFRAVLLGYKTE